MGFDIDVGNAVCAKLKVKCVWVENSFDSLIPAMQARKFDAINSDMTITDQRKGAIDFTNPIYAIPNQLIAKKGSKILPTADGLKGAHVGVLQGSIQETYAKAKWAAAGVDVVSYQAQDQVYADLAAGRLDRGKHEQQGRGERRWRDPVRSRAVGTPHRHHLREQPAGEGSGRARIRHVAGPAGERAATGRDRDDRR